MMTAKEYEALKNSIPETRPEGERGAAAIAAHLKGKAQAHDLSDGMDDRRMTPGEFVRHSMQAAGWPEPGETVQLQDIRDELMRVEYRQQMALAGRDPIPRDEFMALSERRNALSAALAAARVAAAV